MTLIDWFSLSHKHSCGSPYDFDSDFAASENQPLLSTQKFCRLISTQFLREFVNRIFSLRGGGGGGWIGVHKSADPLWFSNQIRPSIIAVNPKSRQKNFNYTQRPKSGSKNIWIRNPLRLQDPEIQKNLTLNLKSRQNYFQNPPIHSPIHPFPLW